MTLTLDQAAEKFLIIAQHIGIDLSTQAERDAAVKAEADAQKAQDTAAAKEQAKAEKP